MKNYGIILIILSVLTSCQPSNNTYTPDPKEGDEWIYRYTDYDESGNVVSTSDITFVGDTGQAFVHVQIPSNPNMLYPPAGYFRMESDGLHYLTNISLGGSSHIYLKYPSSNGEVVSLTTNPESNMITVSNHDSLTVPYGFFPDLYQYQRTFIGGPTANIWFTDSTWIVKYEALDSLSSGTGIYVDYSYKLISYTPH